MILTKMNPKKKKTPKPLTTKKKFRSVNLQPFPYILCKILTSVWLPTKSKYQSFIAQIWALFITYWAEPHSLNSKLNSSKLKAQIHHQYFQLNFASATKESKRQAQFLRKRERKSTFHGGRELSPWLRHQPELSPHTRRWRHSFRQWRDLIASKNLIGTIETKHENLQSKSKEYKRGSGNLVEESEL